MKDKNGMREIVMVDMANKKKMTAAEKPTVVKEPELLEETGGSEEEDE